MPNRWHWLEDFDTRRIRILQIEDDPLDGELVADQLAQSGLDVELRREDSEEGVVRQLAEFKPDVVLSDLAMPGFSGYRALELVRAQSQYTPFIFVSGTIGEEAAVQALRRGATDYVLKQNMTRLSHAVERGLREARDQLQRDRAEAELLRSQRMESLALLAGGLSHDLRNVLQPLLMVAPIVTSRTQDPKLLKLADMVENCARRGLDMVASMLTFARGGTSAHGRVPVSQLFRDLELLLKGSLTRAMRLEIETLDDTLAIQGNETELQQTLLNLALNAVQAMPQGGTLTLSAEPAEVGRPLKLDGDTLQPGRYVRLSVVDTGTGMSEDVLQRLFTPFFTTKDDGTGLGLLSCKRIVDNHGGAIRVRSTLGEGTRFELFLPRAAAAQTPTPLPEPSTARTPAPAPVLRERVMIVAEAVSMLSLLGDALVMRDYRVTSCQGGAAAIREIEANGLPDLVVIDADLRLMAAGRTLAEIHRRGYGGRVLALIDEPADLPARERPRGLDVRTLHKPVMLEDLWDAVRTAVART